MGTEVMKSFGALQFELEQAKSGLKDVDENIKRLIGRDPSENQRPSKRSAPPQRETEDPRNRRINNNRTKQFENDDPAPKKRNVESNVFKRLSERPTTRYHEDDMPELPSKGLISRVIVTPKEVPTRQDVLKAQSADERSKARNRRMFGALLGTLQKFRQEETKLKPKEEKRAQVEKKLEEQQIKEREEMKKERADLFYNRKKKQAEIRMIELKMTRMREHSEWEEKQKLLMNFIQTKTKPHIYFLPKVLNEQNKKLLETCKTNIEKLMEKKRQDVSGELSAIENRMKKNFSRKDDGKDHEDNENDDEHDDHVDHIELVDNVDHIDHEHELHQDETQPDLLHEVEKEVKTERTSENIIDNCIIQENLDMNIEKDSDQVKNEKQLENKMDDETKEDEVKQEDDKQ